MASPQLENGYIKIATEIWEALTSIRISGEARQVLDFIIRKTYGWGKKEDKISLSQFALATKISKISVIKAINKLISMNLITKKGNQNTNSYKFNKDFSSWKPLPKKVIITKKGNMSLPKKVHTINTNTINTISVSKETPKQLTSKNMNNQQLNDGDIVYEDENEEYRKPLKEKAEQKKQVDEFFEYYLAEYEKKISSQLPDIDKRSPKFRKMVATKIKFYSFDKLKELLDKYFDSNDKFFVDNIYSLNVFLATDTLNKLKIK